MISGANEEELDIANGRADLLLEIEKQKSTIQYLSECINEKDGLIISQRSEINRLDNIINKTTTYYYKTLNKYNNQNKKMPDEAVEMFNLLENNK